MLFFLLVLGASTVEMLTTMDLVPRKALASNVAESSLKSKQMVSSAIDLDYCVILAWYYCDTEFECQQWQRFMVRAVPWYELRPSLNRAGRVFVEKGYSLGRETGDTVFI